MKNIGYIYWIFAFACLTVVSSVHGQEIKASRRAEKGCVWQKLQSDNPKRSVLVQQCDYGFRKITHALEGNALVARYSDASADAEPEKEIEFFDKDSADSPEATLRKQFISKLSDYEQKHCVAKQTKSKWILVKPFSDKAKTAWDIESDKEYTAKIKKETPEGDMPADSCGAYGLPVDSRSYFEFHSSSSSHFAFVQVGQDTPLFDEQSIDF